MKLVPGFGLVDLADPTLGERLAEVGAGHLAVFAGQMRNGLMAASVAIGLEVLAELFQNECTLKAGPKGKHQPDRAAVRHGTETGKVRLGGRKITVERPRLRTADKTAEVGLESWDLATSTDMLTEHMVAAMLAGVSTRSYASVALEDVGDVAGSGVSRSAVSRTFVAATAERLAEFRARDLSDRQWLVVFADGFDFAGQMMIGALGVTADGTKVPLGVAQGTTENTAVCKTLFASIKERGFDASHGVLFVLDGGKGLRKAVTTVFDGDPIAIARCHAHKERNILDHLPDEQHAWVQRDLRSAWRNPSAVEAKAKLEQLAKKLDRINPDAAGSLREGLDETLTIIALGVTGTLAKTLATTNPMESTVDIVRAHARLWANTSLAGRMISTCSTTKQQITRLSTTDRQLAVSIPTRSVNAWMRQRRSHSRGCGPPTWSPSQLRPGCERRASGPAAEVAR
ncbi:MAG: transposase [Actinobacteria bacterium]|nr:transposase [Actinomycetota bacterium]